MVLPVGFGHCYQLLLQTCCSKKRVVSYVVVGCVRVLGSVPGIVSVVAVALAIILLFGLLLLFLLFSSLVPVVVYSVIIIIVTRIAIAIPSRIASSIAIAVTASRGHRLGLVRCVAGGILDIAACFILL